MIGKEHTPVLRTTVNALMKIDESLAQANPDTLIFITSHLVTATPAIAFNICPTYETNFEEYGDYATKITVPGDPAFAQQLKQPFDTDRQTVPIVVVSRPVLDHGISTPLSYLRVRSSVHLVPIGDSLTTHGQELAVGAKLRTYLLQTHRRVALLASANLSHRLSSTSPAGYSPKAKAFDRRVLTLITHHQPTALARIRTSTLAEVQACGLGPILMLFGLLAGTDLKPELLAYESPFGIGHPTLLFAFQA